MYRIDGAIDSYNTLTCIDCSFMGIKVVVLFVVKKNQKQTLLNVNGGIMTQV